MDYSKLPEHCRHEMRRYLESGAIPGSFLQSVICNQLVESFANADEENTALLRHYADFLYNDCPTIAWGSLAKMKAYSKSKGN